MLTTHFLLVAFHTILSLESSVNQYLTMELVPLTFRVLSLSWIIPQYIFAIPSTSYLEE